MPILIAFIQSIDDKEEILNIFTDKREDRLKISDVQLSTLLHVIGQGIQSRLVQSTVLGNYLFQQACHHAFC